MNGIGVVMAVLVGGGGGGVYIPTGFMLWADNWVLHLYRRKIVKWELLCK